MSKTTLDDAARQRFGLDFLPENLHGPVGADLVYTNSPSTAPRAAASLDPCAATLDVDSFDWHKPPGQPAHGEFNAEFVDGHLTKLADLALRGRGSRCAAIWDSRRTAS
ncbi:MAG: hypothetical protein WDN69_29335 [Aliidongia sp.]